MYKFHNSNFKLFYFFSSYLRTALFFNCDALLEKPETTHPKPLSVSYLSLINFFNPPPKKTILLVQSRFRCCLTIFYSLGLRKCFVSLWVQLPFNIILILYLCALFALHMHRLLVSNSKIFWDCYLSRCHFELIYQKLILL